jgi:hypothetical protein
LSSTNEFERDIVASDVHDGRSNELGEAQSRNPPKTGPKITPKTIINCPKLTPMVLIEGQWQCAAFSRQVLQKFKALCYREELDV